jgi:hypothetical protein
VNIALKKFVPSSHSLEVFFFFIIDQLLAQPYSLLLFFFLTLPFASTKPAIIRFYRFSVFNDGRKKKERAY